MKELMTNLAMLLKVKTIITLCVMAVWMVLALSGSIEPGSVTNIALMVLSFYFGSQVEKQNKSK